VNKLAIKTTGLAAFMLLSCAIPVYAADNLILTSPQLKTIQPITTLNTVDKITLPQDTTTSTSTGTQAGTATGTSTSDKLIQIKPNLDLPLRVPAGQESKDKKDKGTDWGKLVQSIFTEYWVQMLALIVSVIGVILAVSGFSLANKKKRKYLKKYLHEIDNVYSSFKWKSRRCEVELYRLQDQVEEHLKDGKIDENTYHLLEARIQKYLDEMKESDHRQPREVSEMKKEAGHKTAAKKLSDQIDEAGKDL
jgi:hypothetical protein